MRKILFIVLSLLLVGCAPTQQSAVVEEIAIPTFRPTSTAEIDLFAAERVALAFLDAWQRQDFDSMYSLLSFNSQEAYPLEDFREIYIASQDTITMASLSFQPRSILRIGTRTVQLYYDVSFDTNILGQFSDTGRTLTIILDSRATDWQVAWSVADIFAEMGAGARLEFDSSTPSRANIYDRDGVVLADMNGVYVRVFVVQNDIPNLDVCRRTILDTVDVSEARLDAIFDTSQPHWVMEVGTMEATAYQAYRERLETDCDATFDSMPIRRYLPPGNPLPHVIGYVGYPSESEISELVRQGFDAETIIGRAGIERAYDTTLRGRPSGRLSLIAPDGSRLRVLAEASSQIPESIWLTIDIDLQTFVLEVIGRAYSENRIAADGGASWGSISPGASAIVMDVNTGEILAMVSYPFFDPNAYTPFPAIGREVAALQQEAIAEDSRNPQLNRATLGIYPSGSIFKVIDAMAVLDTGIYDEETTYFCSGVWEFEGDRRFDWLPGGHGSMTARTGIRNSCNPFFYQTGFVLNNVDPFILPNYARVMGLGAVTGINVLPEAAGTIPDPDLIRTQYGRVWTYSDAVNMAIGQGEVQVTPLQMVRLYAGIANGGTLYRPLLVRERGILDQRTFVAEPDAMTTYEVSEDAMRIVREGMCDVTTAPTGTARYIFLPYGQAPSPLNDYQGGVCGKTGTAQSPRPEEAPHAWFAAYAPADNPEIAVVVMVENSGDGSAVAAPMTKQIMEYYFFLMDREE
ncbi:MAG: penicillin-binding transpeptidase domain-containing protein [Anaerolineae bacterium]|nr:penicillin-binding transpeptidase domain-containing protein [Anaerolineae bacterium]MDQ7033317.1 penicillin-binding transpeptidase domain-containing protein [Anaerolineae bacterium]